METELRYYTYPNTIYIGRQNKAKGLKTSKWHNPFPKNKYGLQQCLQYFWHYFIGDYETLKSLSEYNSLNKLQPLINDVEELRGKRLGCYCCYPTKRISIAEPLKCHGQFYLRALRRDYDFYTVNLDNESFVDCKLIDKATALSTFIKPNGEVLLASKVLNSVEIIKQPYDIQFLKKIDHDFLIT